MATAPSVSRSSRPTAGRSDNGREWLEGTEDEEIDDSFTYHPYPTPDDCAIGLTVTWSAQYQVVGEHETWQDVPGTVDVAGEPVALEATTARPYLVE